MNSYITYSGVMTMTEVAISMQNLTKYYGSFKGIENVSLEVNKGTIHGFLGPNGAGKTTTLRTLVGLLKKTSGEATIFGYKAGSVESRKHIGYLPSDFELYSYYSVKEYLDYLERLRGSAPFRKELVERFQLDESRKTSELSRGNKQKVAIVQALMHRPELLIADEPTAGLDPLMQEEFDAVLKEYVASGEKTVFISSHILSEVQKTCETVTIIREGNIVASGNVKELLSTLPRTAILQVTDVFDVAAFVQQHDYTLKNQSGSEVTISFDDVKEFMEVISATDEIRDLTIPPADLEEYFMAYYK